MRILIFFILCSYLLAIPTARIKDIARLDGVRKNQLIGTGLVIGLNGTGDKTTLTQEMLNNTMRNLGLNMQNLKVTPKNAAAVIITADLEPFMNPGDSLDVTVSTLGDSTSLQGGVLIQTPMKAADGRVYVVAQGSVSIGGIGGGGNQGGGGGHKTVGRIPNGGIVEQGVNMPFANNNILNYVLNNKDFTTANRIAESINQKFGETCSMARDAGKIQVTIPFSFQENPVEFVSIIDNMEVGIDQEAKVVINERTGTIVLGGNVTISPIAISHNGLMIQVGNKLNKSGVAQNLVEVDRGSTVQELVNTLNLMGVNSKDLTAILQEVKNAGALQAHLEIL